MYPKLYGFIGWDFIQTGLVFGGGLKMSNWLELAAILSGLAPFQVMLPLQIEEPRKIEGFMCSRVSFCSVDVQFICL